MYPIDTGPAFSLSFLPDTSAESFTLKNEPLGPEILTRLGTEFLNYSQLKTLSLPLCAIGHDGARAIARILKNKQSLSSLDLSANFLKDAGVASIVKPLLHHTGLTSLDLTANHISSAGAVHLGTLLSNNSTLTKLVLNMNEDLGPDGATFIGDALLTNTTLTVLHLAMCKLKSSGLGRLCNALAVNTALTELDLRCNGINARGTIAPLAAVLSWNTSLTVLTISNNKFRVEGARLIAEALTLNTTLTELGFSDPSIREAGSAHIAAALKFNGSITGMDLADVKMTEETQDLIQWCLERNIHNTAQKDYSLFSRLFSLLQETINSGMYTARPL